MKYLDQMLDYTNTPNGQRAVNMVLAIVVFWILLFSFLKGWAGVNNWAIANWNLTYDFGFYKRALLGSLVRPVIDSGFLGLSRAYLIKIIGLGVLLVFVIICARMLISIYVRSERSLSYLFMALVFAVSPYAVLSSNLVAYFDYILNVALIVSLWLMLSGRYCASLGVVVIGLLIHEAALLIIYPLCVFVLMLRQDTKGRHPLSLSNLGFSAWGVVIIPLLVTGIIFFAQGQFQSKEELAKYMEPRIVEDLRETSNYDSFQNGHLDGANSLKNIHGTASYMVELIVHPIGGYVYEEFPKGWQRLSDSEYLLDIGILLLFVWFFSVRFLRVCNHPWILSIFYSLAVFAPLLLHFVAFDTERIWGMPVFTVLAGLWLVSSFFSTVPKDTIMVQMLKEIFLIVMFFGFSVLRPFHMSEGFVDIYYWESVFYSLFPLAFMVFLFLAKYRALLNALPCGKC